MELPLTITGKNNWYPVGVLVGVDRSVRVAVGVGQSDGVAVCVGVGTSVWVAVRVGVGVDAARVNCHWSDAAPTA